MPLDCPLVRADEFHPPPRRPAPPTAAAIAPQVRSATPEDRAAGPVQSGSAIIGMALRDLRRALILRQRGRHGYFESQSEVGVARAL